MGVVHDNLALLIPESQVINIQKVEVVEMKTDRKHENVAVLFFIYYLFQYHSNVIIEYDVNRDGMSLIDRLLLC